MDSRQAVIQPQVDLLPGERAPTLAQGPIRDFLLSTLGCVDCRD